MSGRQLLALQPKVRPELRLARPLRRGAAEVHLVWDPVGGRQLELGPKEHFIIARLDGTRSLAEVGEQYAVRFRARLGEPQWQQLLGLLYARGLLDHAPAPEPPQAAPPARSSALSGRVKLVADAPALLDRMHRATGFARRRSVLAPLLVLVTALLAGVAVNARTLLGETARLAENPVALLAVGTLLWTSLALHELAHGLVGRAFGGQVREIGLRWRLPMTYLYCEVENVRFFRRRREQIATALAGAVMNLAFLLPFYPAWLLLPDHAQARPFLGALLLLGTAVALGNLLPLPPLDGYKALGYALDCLQLATESRRFTVLLARSAVRRDSAPLRGYPPGLRLAYGGYALGCAVLTAALFAALGGLLAHRYGAAAGWLPVAAALAALVLWAAGQALRAHRARQVGESGKHSEQVT
ncbi:M50 family metallopeptidase [Streptomyces sp. TLI_171]|uniref:M50 family metallopeptidase n=1 Tax=Streptomyces sp. TLI_171 TaxID=1938859 RepID=UPI000C18AC30|nr:M50 family metallopeptidase [Streptomyces sp. TLI_171]RKE17540.1 putative peptide zinc metalloprotease protein [Streptomyces sp. TLI_171]